jgi:hypothetical protein
VRLGRKYLLRYYSGSIDYDVVHNNELLFNPTRRTGVSSPWISEKRGGKSKEMRAYWTPLILLNLHILFFYKLDGKT